MELLRENNLQDKDRRPCKLKVEATKNLFLYYLEYGEIIRTFFCFNISY